MAELALELSLSDFEIRTVLAVLLAAQERYERLVTEDPHFPWGDRAAASERAFRAVLEAYTRSRGAPPAV